MNGEIVQRAIAGALFAAPGEGRLGVGHVVLVHLDAKMLDRTDRAAGEKLGDVADRGTLNIVVAEYGDPAAGPRRRLHALRVGETGRHRLFAPYVLARFEGRHRQGRVQSIGRRDRNDVDRGIGNKRSPVGR